MKCLQFPVFCFTMLWFTKWDYSRSEPIGRGIKGLTFDQDYFSEDKEVS